jgi:hypothetical protein
VAYKWIARNAPTKRQYRERACVGKSHQTAPGSRKKIRDLTNADWSNARERQASLEHWPPWLVAKFDLRVRQFAFDLLQPIAEARTGYAREIHHSLPALK